MSEEVNSVSFFAVFSFREKRICRIRDEGFPFPLDPLLLLTFFALTSFSSLTHSGSFQFLLFSRGRQEHNTSFSPIERRKKGNLNSFLSLRAISVTVSWRLWERGRRRKKKGDRREGASRFWQGGGKEEEGGNTEERLFFLREFVCNSECFLFPATSQLAT